MNDTEPLSITIYGADWCGDVRRTRRYLEDHDVPHDFVDVDVDIEGERKVLRWNSGRRRIPTVEVRFDGETEILSVPSSEALDRLVARYRELTLATQE